MFVNRRISKNDMLQVIRRKEIARQYSELKIPAGTFRRRKKSEWCFETLETLPALDELQQRMSKDKIVRTYEYR